MTAVHQSAPKTLPIFAGKSTGKIYLTGAANFTKLAVAMTAEELQTLENGDDLDS